MKWGDMELGIIANTENNPHNIEEDGIGPGKFHHKLSTPNTKAIRQIDSLVVENWNDKLFLPVIQSLH